MRLFFTVGICGLALPVLLFAQSAAITDALRRQEELRIESKWIREQIVSVQEQLVELEAKQKPSIVVTDPIAKDFAKLPFVARLRVRDATGVSFGTGSVILSEEGRALIITVSHIFRNANEKSVIEADIFNPNTGKVETFTTGYKGIVTTNPDSDLGLLVIPANRVIPVVSLFPANKSLKVGEHVESYGCGGGEPPSLLQHTITVFNRYVGPDTIECTGVPKEGRSGGALVNKQGKLIGITIAADKRDQKGLYTGLTPIHDILKSVGIDPKTLEK